MPSHVMSRKCSGHHGVIKKALESKVALLFGETISSSYAIFIYLLINIPQRLSNQNANFVTSIYRCYALWLYKSQYIQHTPPNA